MTKTRRINALYAPWGGLAILVLVVCLLEGCISLPDTSGYTAATIQVKQAVGATGDIVEGELEAAIEAEATTANAESVKNLKAAWAATMRSLDAMVAHAQSIEQIVQAGNQGRESANEVADSVKSLIDAVKVDALTGVAGKVAELSADTVAFVYGEYSKHVSAKSLEEALDKFGPSISRITGLVQAQIADARRLFAQQIEAQVQLLQSEPLKREDAGVRFGNWIKHRDKLDDMAELATKLLVRGIETEDPQEIARAKTMISHVEAGRKLLAPKLAEYKANEQALRRREKAGRTILRSAEKSIAAWGTAHQQLVKAVKERRPVSVEALTLAVIETRTLLQRWSEL